MQRQSCNIPRYTDSLSIVPADWRGEVGYDKGKRPVQGPAAHGMADG